jgi:hypothetical protein
MIEGAVTDTATHQHALTNGLMVFKEPLLAEQL